MYIDSIRYSLATKSMIYQQRRQESTLHISFIFLSYLSTCLCSHWSRVIPSVADTIDSAPETQTSNLVSGLGHTEFSVFSRRDRPSDSDGAMISDSREISPTASLGIPPGYYRQWTPNVPANGWPSTRRYFDYLTSLVVAFHRLHLFGIMR